MRLSPSDRDLLLELRECNILQEIDGHRLDLRNGAILLPCSDGDQFADLFTHHGKIVTTHRDDPRVHPLALNGGPLLLAQNCVLAREDREDLVLIKHARQAHALKQMAPIALVAHAPCGAAGLANLSVLETLGMLAQAKWRVKAELPELKSACFFHVDWSEGRKRLYFFPVTVYEAWRATQQTPVMAG